jgi:hypothetical protein
MKIKLSKSQWEGIGKKAGWMPDEKEESQKWWGSLSINEMKALTRKYYTDPHITWSFVNQTPSLVEDIYQKENNGKTSEAPNNKTAASQKTTKPQNVIDAPKDIKASDLFKKFLQEGKKPGQAAEELLDILTTGTFAAIEEPKKTEMINNVIEKFSNDISRRRYVKVTMSDGDTITTWINGTKKEIEDHYLNHYSVKSDEKTMRRGVHVEFLD